MSKGCIAVTGASGAIGRRLVRLLADNGFSVIALQRDPSLQHGGNIVSRCFALSDSPGKIAEQIEGAEQVVHLAAIIPGKVPDIEGDTSLWTVNVLGTQRLIKAMSLAGAKRLVLTGTANIYGPGQTEAYEDSPFGPQSRILYLASKASQEWLAAAMCNEREIEHAILRISSVIGDGRSIIDRLARDLAMGNPVQIHDGAAFGADFIDRDDVCDGLLLAIETSLNGAYNLSSGKRTELIDIVFELAKRVGRPVKDIEMIHALKAPDTGFPAINSDRLQSFGFNPKPLPDVLARIATEALAELRRTSAC